MLFIHMLMGLFVSFMVLASSVSAATGPVWQVSKEGRTLYIGGTIHVLSEEDYPLPSVFDTAYQKADILVFEVETAHMQAPSFQRLMLEQSTYTDGVTLKDTLSASTYEQLRQYLASHGRDVNSVAQFKPGMLSILLTLNELQRLGQLGQGVDDFFDAKARRDNKPRQFLETIEQQLGFLSTMGAGQEDELVLYTLKDIRNLSATMAELKTSWRQGNNTRLERLSLTPWVEQFPDIYQSLLVKRNQAWLPKIEAMLATTAVEYVLVGALHLVGDDGVLEGLRQRGYQVRKLSN